MFEIVILLIAAIAAVAKWRWNLLLMIAAPVYLIGILGNRAGNGLGGRLRNIGGRNQATPGASVAMASQPSGGYAALQRNSFLTTDVLAAAYTDTTGQISAPDGYPYLAGVSLSNNDIDATTTDNGGIESFRVMDSAQIIVLAGPYNYGIGCASINSDVSAADDDQPATRYALVNLNIGNAEIVVEARAAVVDTNAITNLLWSTGPINGYGMVDSSMEGLLAHSFVATANIGTAFEDFFAVGDISPPGPQFKVLAGVAIRNDEIADTLGQERWQLIASDQTTVLHGPTSDGIQNGSLQGDVSLIIKTNPWGSPCLVNTLAPHKFNIQSRSTVETDGTCNVIFAKRNIGLADLIFPVGA